MKRPSRTEPPRRRARGARGSAPARTAAAIGIALCCTAPAAHAQSRPSVDTLDARLARVERVLDQSLLEQLQRVDSLERELRALRGENEALANELERLTRRERDLYEDTDRRVGALEEAVERGAIYGTNAGGIDETLVDGGVGAGSDGPRDGPLDLTGDGSGDGSGDAPGGGAPLGRFTGGEGASDAEPPPATLAELDFGDGPRPPEGLVRDTASAAEKTAYTQAYDLLARGQNDEAVARFGDFLERYPDGPYSDNAWYWQGEAMYARRRFDDAVRNFRVVVEAFPNGPKVPDARLKIGYSLYEQGEYAAARELLTAVRDEYPGRSAAVLARKRLQQMDREGR